MNGFTAPRIFPARIARSPFVVTVIMLCLAAPVFSAETVADDPAVTAEMQRFFETEVRPLLVESCGECHGSGKAESGLRLNGKAALRAGGDSGPVINAEDPDQSLLLKVIGYQHSIQMPPEGKLADREIEVLRKWVRSGAWWPEDASDQAVPSGLRAGPINEQERQHWAYQPIVKPSVPDLAQSFANSSAADLADWADTEIDRFILADLLDQGLRPAADAGRRPWLRRVTMDLTGLPPTPDEMESFLADDSPQAHLQVIDRLLASPHYGQRWGRHWLDLVRYADTAGDGADYPIREAYRYRDYVIDALNADKPYDAFIREQIAGDILAQQAAATGEVTPERFAEQIIATGYIAITKRFGYNINTEFQHLDIADTLDNLGHAVLGLSIACARCHDHKYDAITAEDYYALYGIFSSSQYSFPGGEEHKRPHHLVALALPSEVEAVKQRIAGEVGQLDQQIKTLEEGRDALLAQTRRGVSRDPGWELQSPDKPGGSPWFTAGPNTILQAAQSPYTHVYPAGKQGVRIAHGVPTDGIRQEFADVTAAQTATFHFNLDFRNVAAVEGDGAYRFYLGRGAIQSLALECSVNSYTFSIRDGDQFRVVRKLDAGQWYNLQLSIDMAAKTFSGRIGRPGDVVEFQDFATAPSWDGVLNTFVSDGYGQIQTVSPSRDIDNVIGQSEPLAPLPAAFTEQDDQAEAVVDWAQLKQRLSESEVELQRLTAARAELQASADFPMAYGVSEGTPANARLQKRGEPDRLGDEVPRRFLQVLGGQPLPPQATGSGRLQLAQWLTDRDNPLTARVIVNRVWQHLLGRGLVNTPNDFGVRGEQPSHPELLDFLAAQFMADGWSIKRLQRRILASHVYRLASVESPQHRSLDPDNRWFARHRRRALDAESIRDAMLAVSGYLDHASGGPHPFPDVNSWGFTIHYPFHAVYESNHRSVYLMIQRARRHPFLALFDAADPNISTAKRQRTITPTQSLYLMNAPLVHAQAAGLAERVLSSGERILSSDPGDAVTSTQAAITRAYALTLCREPNKQELAQATAFLHESRDLLQTAGDADSERSAWQAFCRVLLTSNEFLHYD